MQIIPAIGRLGVLMWVVQASAQETSSLTVSRDPDAALGADDVGKISAGVSKPLWKNSARTSNRSNVADKVTFKRNGPVTTSASLAPAARSLTGRGGESFRRFPSCASRVSALLRSRRLATALAG